MQHHRRQAHPRLRQACTSPLASQRPRRKHHSRQLQLRCLMLKQHIPQQDRTAHPRPASLPSNRLGRSQRRGLPQVRHFKRSKHSRLCRQCSVRRVLLRAQTAQIARSQPRHTHVCLAMAVADRQQRSLPALRRHLSSNPGQPPMLARPHADARRTPHLHTATLSMRLVRQRA